MITVSSTITVTVIVASIHKEEATRVKGHQMIFEISSVTHLIDLETKVVFNIGNFQDRITFQTKKYLSVLTLCRTNN